ncbi:MAG: succinylglutamate desuccinylase/aspartoacylase family protein, partial [Gemmatimonadetes bacterium]|nr:succinylglutamate desuccinylase/aspartoacylase family protein [Gemmatimonadota bacterium]
MRAKPQYRLHRSPYSILLLPVLTALIGCSQTAVPTPLELAEGDVLTSYEDMMVFLDRLRLETGGFTIDTIGESLEGRALVALRFGATGQAEATSSDKLKVLIYAQQHGNEPSGKEAAIALARDIATGADADLVEGVDFYLVPQVNPDGSEKGQRRNAADMDLNRDHLPLSTPEVAALHSLYNRILPHVTLDVHEYGFAGSTWVDAGLLKNFGQQIGALSNANMSMVLRSFAWDEVIPQMQSALIQKDVLLRRYLVTDGPDARFRYSTTALNDGRNSMGIYHSLSFLIEGRNGLTVESDIRERTRQQLETIKAFLRFFGEHSEEVRNLVDQERGALVSGDLSDQVALVMDYVPDPDRPSLTVGVIDIETGEEADLTIETFAPAVEATHAVSRPLGYVIP